jgi:four helix bundle protein
MASEAQLKARTKQFALDVISLVDRLPKDRVADHMGRQLLRSSTSVAANYRAACRAKSAADMANKLAICEEEADESEFWLELLDESGRAQGDGTAPLRSEASELVAIFVASRKTLRNGIARGQLREVVATYSESVPLSQRPE